MFARFEQRNESMEVNSTSSPLYPAVTGDSGLEDYYTYFDYMANNDTNFTQPTPFSEEFK